MRGVDRQDKEFEGRFRTRKDPRVESGSDGASEVCGGFRCRYRNWNFSFQMVLRKCVWCQVSLRKLEM